MGRHVVIVGAGINGLVAANYLRRGGFDVTVLEAKPRIGGAVSTGTFIHEGRKVVYPTGASVFGFMQDFVFRETGLAAAVPIYRPKHPEIVYAGPDDRPCLMEDDPAKLAKELAARWNEQGKVEAFFSDLAEVVKFLRHGYRKAEVPTLRSAEAALGRKTVDLWIKGSAKDLLDRYFTADRTKAFMGISSTESGPVPLGEPYSAFSIPLMMSGGVFDGEWGHVKGGIWQLTAALARINKKLGVRIITSAKVMRASSRKKSVSYVRSGKKVRLKADQVVFATDPLSAARVLGDKKLMAKVARKRSVGSSGKLIMAFKRPVEWLDDTGRTDFDMAMRLFIAAPTLQDMDRSSAAVRNGRADFAPGYFEIYCEGAGDRKMGGKRSYDLVSVFFKSLAFGKRGKDLPEVKKAVEELVLSKIRNRGDLIRTILLTPRDIRDLFGFPGGNIDHIELAVGQTFFDRHYSPDPERSFYQFGDDPDISYCAAGSYPCGSVAGTPGYMCAQQMMKRLGGKRRTEKDARSAAVRRTCSRGHVFRRTAARPVCPRCWPGRYRKP